jgi:hypothetical protein
MKDTNKSELRAGSNYEKLNTINVYCCAAQNLLSLRTLPEA